MHLLSNFRVARLPPHECVTPLGVLRPADVALAAAKLPQHEPVPGAATTTLPAAGAAVAATSAARPKVA